jgi:hypothetical protein
MTVKQGVGVRGQRSENNALRPEAIESRASTLLETRKHKPSRNKLIPET